jgi:hypothetical protein
MTTTHTMPFNVRDLRPKLDADIIHVTPELAQKWLARNTSNRNLKPTKIAQYARDMAAGNWLLTGEAIKFSADGTLLDGQNRLHAVVASGETIALLVVRGLDPAVQGVMDTGATRTGGDALTMRGINAAKDVAASASTLIQYRRGVLSHCMSQVPSYERPTHSEIVAQVSEAPQLIESAVFGKKIYRQLPLPVGPLAVAHMHFVAIDANDAAAYFDAIADLRTSGKGDPINTLMKRVSEMRARRERVLSSTSLFLLFRSWNAFRSGEEMQKFQFGSDGRGWAPIPQPR